MLHTSCIAIHLYNLIPHIEIIMTAIDISTSTSMTIIPSVKNCKMMSFLFAPPARLTLTSNFLSFNALEKQLNKLTPNKNNKPIVIPSLIFMELINCSLIVSFSDSGYSTCSPKSCAIFSILFICSEYIVNL
mgnify:CR=1 FL=1